MGKFESTYIYPYIKNKTITYLQKIAYYYVERNSRETAVIHRKPQQKIPLHYIRF